MRTWEEGQWMPRSLIKGDVRWVDGAIPEKRTGRFVMLNERWDKLAILVWSTESCSGLGIRLGRNHQSCRSG